MAERRKPTYILLLKIPSKKKTVKVELFDRKLFTNEPMRGKCRMPQYRLRVKGKWFGNKRSFYASWQIKELFWRGLPF
jgi:hypothetical protein